MFLKRIEVKGFKSFADKVELELDKGITGVVGPNGSGKSNISDAVRWVLGEQSAKNLRGAKMEDVIFAGTDIRKPLGFAEVSITIDNTDSMLHVEYSEITVTRRIYRSGESEYYLNKTGCRLKDITELFMDTGVGRDGYSIIGQGRIDEILNAKAEDRREIFEEAAGIVKYKSRKQESEKKLDITEQNITRLMDIVNELESQLEPLSEQALKARRFMDMRERLKVLELNLFIKNIDKAKEKLRNLNENHSNLEDELLGTNRKNARLEEDYLKAKNSISDMDTSIENVQAEIYSSKNEMERFQGEVNVLNEKVLNINKNVSRLDEEIDRENQEIEEHNRLQEDNNKNLNVFNGLLYEQEQVLNQASTEFNKINSEISEKEILIENNKAEVIELLNSIANQRNSINSLNAFKSNMEKRKKQINAEELEKNKRIGELDNDLVKMSESIELHQKNYKDIREKILKLDISKKDISSEKTLVEKDIFELNGKMHSKQAQCKILNEMENEFEGYYKSVKEIMKLKSTDKALSSGVCGVVADLIVVPREYEIAIEAALGSALQNIVTEDEFVAKRCINYLKQYKLGRATFLPLSTISGKNNVSNEKLIKDGGGYIGVASELIGFSARFKNIVSSLLGRVIIVDNIDNGIAIAKKTNYSAKIVTLDGEIISPGGAFTGGSINQKSGRILSRKREIEELEKDLTELSEFITSMNKRRSLIDSKLSSIEDEMKKVIEERHSIEMQISACTNNCKVIKSDIERIQKDIKNLDTELIQIAAEETEVESKLKEVSEKLSLLEMKNLSLTESVQLEQGSVKDILSNKERLTLEITSIKVKIAEYKHSITSYNDKVKEIQEDTEKCKLLILNKTEEKTKEKDEINKVSFSIKNIETLIESITVKSTETKNRLEILLEKKKENIKILDGMENKRKEYNDSTSLLQEEIHRLEMQKARLDMELENLQNKIWEEYEVSYAAAQKYRIEIDNISQALKEISNIKDDVKGLGSVNIGAIDEYKRVKERYEFLIKQESDLEEAKNSLQKLIDEMTEKMEIQFSNNFAVINENFNITFQQLFGGGRAELVLCDKDDILSSGVDIIAEPPGKRLQSLTLLSGGEKALTAIALLFAILRMKPSPFCILDEIEAALDDINVTRYARFLKELSVDTQFIIVTHRKGTMEISDVLYGVTMEEKGVSRLVSVKLTERAS